MSKMLLFNLIFFEIDMPPRNPDIIKSGMQILTLTVSYETYGGESSLGYQIALPRCFRDHLQI